MNGQTFRHNVRSLATAALTILVLSAASTMAVTTNFNQSVSTAWITPGNWDNGVPTAIDDAVIAAGKTAFWDQTVNGDPAFGTLTLGVGSTFQFKGNNTTGLPAGSNVIFSDGSHLQFTAGSINKTANYQVLAGATATLSPGSNTIPQGTLTGSGNLNVIVSGNTFLRWTTSGFTGDLTFTSNNSSAKFVEITQFGTAPIVGPGVTTFGDKVRAQLQNSNRISDSATIKLVGGTGDSNPKFNLNTDRSDTIANLIIDSPTSSGPTIRARNGFLKVTSGVTFQGTAGTVQIDNALWPSSFNAGLDAINASILFGGTGNWDVTGDGQLRVNGSTVTTNTNATLSNLVVGTTSFTKSGSEKLTLNGDLSLFTGAVNVNAGTLELGSGSNNSLTGTLANAINVAAGATLLHNSSTALTVAPTLNGGTLGGTGLINAALTLDSINDTLSPGNSPGTMPFGVSQNWASFTYDWELNNWDGDLVTGGGVAGTNFDQITIDGTLTLSGSSYELNILSLDALNAPGNVPGFVEDGRSWTILTAEDGITGFDSSEWLINTAGFANPFLGTFVLTTGGQNGGDLVLTYRPFSGVTVPEPTTAALGLLGLAGLMMRRRRAA